MSRAAVLRAYRLPTTIIPVLILGVLTGGVSAKPPVPRPASAAPPKPTAEPLVSLNAMPQKVTLKGPYDSARVMIEGHGRSGSLRDVSGDASLRVADPKIAEIDEQGILRARADGKTILIARLRNRETRLPIEVRGVANAAPPRFVTDVIPVLSKAGCNSGACHGAGAGKGGFKLSLLGYDPDADYEAITRANAARRVSPSQPDNSLLLRKPLMRVAHKGGKRITADSLSYRILRDWIAGGMPAPSATEPRVVRLTITPAVRTLSPGLTQRFAVRAAYSDGSQRDVTSQTLFSASDESVATVSPSGEAKVVGLGEGATLIRYQSLVATARVVSPYGPTLKAGYRGSGMGIGGKM